MLQAATAYFGIPTTDKEDVRKQAHQSDQQIEGLPATIRRAGPQAAERTVEFFTAQIRNPHTRAAYAAAVTRFFTWCDARGLALAELSPIAVATYIEEMHSRYRAPTFKQHLAAIRRLFDWLVTGHFRHAENVTPDTLTGLSPDGGIPPKCRSGPRVDWGLGVVSPQEGRITALALTFERSRALAAPLVRTVALSHSSARSAALQLRLACFL